MLRSADEDGADLHLKMFSHYDLYWVVFDRFYASELFKRCFEDGFENSKQVLPGLGRVFLRRPQRNKWAFGSGESFVLRTRDLLPRAMPLEVIFQ